MGKPGLHAPLPATFRVPEVTPWAWQDRINASMQGTPQGNPYLLDDGRGALICKSKANGAKLTGLPPISTAMYPGPDSAKPGQGECAAHLLS